jgi:hypothetical protein
MTGVVAVRRVRTGVVRLLKAQAAATWPRMKQFPAAGGDPRAGRYRAAGQALQSAQ